MFHKIDKHPLINKENQREDKISHYFQWKHLICYGKKDKFTFAPISMLKDEPWKSASLNFMKYCYPTICDNPSLLPKKKWIHPLKL